MDHFPLFMDLKGQKALVIGGGATAERKIRLLLKAGASVHVVAKYLSDQVILWRDAGEVIHCAGRFDSVWLDGARLVIAASDEESLNRQIFVAASNRGLPVNVVDRPDLSTFIMPAIVDRGPISVAISSGGKAPMLARHIRIQIEKILPHRLSRLASIFGSWRQQVLDIFPSLQDRLKFWEEAIDSPFAARVLNGSETGENISADILLNIHQQNLDGEVYIVGAGPGDPDLLTVKAVRLMQQADVVLYDQLVSDEVMELVRRDADRIAVGKNYGNHTMLQSEIGELMIKLAKKGKRVLRLKGGDPFIFGRGGEEVQDLSAAGVSFQVVPGITAASGCSAYAGIPLTHRDHAQSVRFVTGHTKQGKLDLDWQSLATDSQTLAVYMGTRSLPDFSTKLVQHGMPDDMPVALVENGTRNDQKVYKGTLKSITNIVSAHQLSGPGLVIVGSVVGLSETCDWFVPTEEEVLVKDDQLKYA